MVEYGKKKSALCRQSRYALLHAIAFALDHARKRKCASSWSDVRQETDITSARTDDVTHGSSYAGNKNAVRREKKNTMKTQWALLNDWEKERGRNGVPCSPALLQLAVVVFQPPRCNLIRALSHERTESALQAGLLLLSSISSFSTTFDLLSLSISFSLFHLLHHPTLVSCCCYALSFRPMVWNPKFRRDLQFEEAY